MASKRVKNSIKESISLVCNFPKYASYSDAILGNFPTFRIVNRGAEGVLLTLCVFGEESVVLPYEEQVEVPFESTVELHTEGLFSPLFLAENDEFRPCVLTARLLLDGREIACESQTVTLLPFDTWEGLEGKAERVALFVRPRMAECTAILQDAGKRLKKWREDAEFYGYTGTDKNAVRQIAASIFASVRNCGIEKEGKLSLNFPVCASYEKITNTKRANAFALALFAAACLERAHLHPVLALGEQSVGVGVWLYDSCFLDTVTDDCEIVNKYLSAGINNLCFFDAEDLFAQNNVSFTPAEEHFAQKLKENYFEYFVDVRRCRMGNLLPCPVRGKGLHGYELYREEELSGERAPTPLPTFRPLKLEGKQPKNKLWERRLLDLSGKNALLNFTGKHALHLCIDGADEFYARLAQQGSMKLKATTSNEAVPAFGGENARAGELIALEQKKGVLRAFASVGEVKEIAQRLFRKNREADEETGAKILYLAFGFLHYADKYAPLVLMPVAVKRAKGNEDFSLEVESEREYFVNSTLLEFLKTEYNIDVRGLGGDVSALKITEIFAMVRAETALMKGWEVTTDVYLSTFSFQNYLLWKDVRSHIKELSQNAIVAALLQNRVEKRETFEIKEEDEANLQEPLLPLPFDSSQYSAVALSAKGASFVLHGPPGTGKSQTITNILANALYQGKRVLFVAEKKAALDVVKKRLDDVGVGDFCLELHSNKADKAEVLKKMEYTLSLQNVEESTQLDERAQELLALRNELKAPVAALHQKRRLGLSVYQAVLLYEQNKHAPDIMDVESSFYDTLTESKLAECKRMILRAAATAKECGGVFSSPFDNVNVSEYSCELRDKLFCASEVVITEIKHLKAFLALLLEFYRQKVSTLTARKLQNLAQIASGLSLGKYQKYFTNVNEEEFYLFFNANRRLDGCLEYYERHFKALVDLSTKERADLKRYCAVGGDYRLFKGATVAVKRLQRVALRPVQTEDIPKFLTTLEEIYGAIERIKENTDLSKPFVDRAGRISFKKRKEFLTDLYDLHAACASVFMDYNADAFNGMCIRATSGYTAPVLAGYVKAYESFVVAQESFLNIAKADRHKLREEDTLDYFANKAGALIDNIDMLSNWCAYQKIKEELTSLGLTFIAETLESGKFKGENVLASFEKNVYRNFLEMNIPADKELSRMTVGTLEETVEKFRLAWEDYTRITRRAIRERLISRLPKAEEEGALSVELSAFTRLSKSNLRRTGLRGLFEEVPALTARVCPCMLMSPVTVAQYLRPEANLFDLVIFDEASQMTTAEAVGAIARAKAAIVVGDPKQLPPTTFFHSAYVDEENLENEDLESILDDCLALGLPEKHLSWHYRSKHESLIAFSNSMYYDNRLCTFPSPDALESKVRLIQVDGVYDRGFTKRNKKEAEALVQEVVRRLQDGRLSRSSMGVVTFSTAQREELERLLTKEIALRKLESVAYDREEPLFIKNLENVQGDERDVILFSVCYGPDKTGRVSLNFGPLNQAGGWRRLNVAVSRAREEMLVFSTMTASMIDLAKTSSKGVAGLKAFLEFAERGKTNLAVRGNSVKAGAGIGKFIASELSAYGYECRFDVGASNFKIDVAVVDAADKRRFILAIVCDGAEDFSIKDRNVLQIQALKRGNWNVMRVNTVSYFNNPKREIKRIKDMLDRLMGGDRKAGSWLSKNKKPYRALANGACESATYITNGENDGDVMARLKAIVAQEEPISRAFLKKRCLDSFGILRSGSKLDARLDALIDGCVFAKDRIEGVDYFYKNARVLQSNKFRVEGENPLRNSAEDFTPYEMIALVKGALEERVALYMDEVLALVLHTFGLKHSEKFASFLRDCIRYGEEKGLFVRSVSDRISLA